MPSEYAQHLVKDGRGLEQLKIGEAYIQRVKTFRERVLKLGDQDWSRRQRLMEILPVQLGTGKLVSKADREQFSKSADFKLMPGLNVFHEVTEAIFNDQFSSPREPGRGDIGDLHHLVALPYVDYFTCDRYIYGILERLKMRQVGRGKAFRSLADVLDEITSTT